MFVTNCLILENFKFKVKKRLVKNQNLNRRPGQSIHFDANLIKIGRQVRKLSRFKYVKFLLWAPPF